MANTMVADIERTNLKSHFFLIAINPIAITSSAGNKVKAHTDNRFISDLFMVMPFMENSSNQSVLLSRKKTHTT